jgi:Reverse transcriptase (RNA-dependent DNA polymerase)
MDKLKKAKYFLKFDVQWATTMFESDLETNGKLHSKQIEDSMNPLLCSSECATPQRLSKLHMMDEIFKKEIEENSIIVYMDDILAFSKTIDGLKKIEWIILEKVQEYDLYFKAKKCKFRKPKIKYLELVIKEGKLAIDPTKLKKILDWPAPKTVKEV